jgi:lipocalin-like protein
MRRRVTVLAVFLLCSGFALAQSEAEIRDRMVGTWKLVSTEQTMKDGSTRPYPQYGPRGKGFLMYTHDGYMCADLVNPDRPKWANPSQLTKEEQAAAADETFAYCGRYEIDVKQNRLIHLPEVATDPGYVGSRQVRPYKFEDGRLVLSDTETQEPGVVRWKIVWEKAR